MCIPSTFCAFLLDIQIVMSTKLTLVLCACFFAFGTYWADWSIDYWLIWADPALNPNAIPNAITYYQNLYNAPQIHKIVLLAPVFIGVVGLSMGFAQMYDINFLFDGGALAMKIIATSEVEPEVVRKLYEIAAGHTLIVFAVVDAGVANIQARTLIV
ncbi:ER membrane protein SH3 [Jimgerdemannia flammicorona]|uniref:ER membrane protein SH3 n=1 Tax=Jimgerdemannia flammicorona TaxID=994334 RepID=A0A433DKG4_9FUNG|nr:ER membrane protein SH3 [Jimgerdemannia flammicorona]